MSLMDRAVEAVRARLEPPGPPKTTGLKQRPAFFDSLRGGLLGPSLSPDEVSGCEAILDACRAWPLAFTAYALATAYHETAHTMQPIKEYGGAAYLRRMYDIAGNRPAKAHELGNFKPGDGVLFCGRGYVQLTGRKNYQRADDELGLGGALVRNPDLALEAPTAAKIMRLGMGEGWFTGKKLADYLPASGQAKPSAYVASRRIINGQDRADDIAAYARDFQTALLAGLWT